MENQYNYYNPQNEPQNFQYNHDTGNNGNKKPKKKMPKAVAVTGLALLFGLVSSATFMSANIVGNKILGWNESSGGSITASLSGEEQAS